MIASPRHLCAGVRNPAPGTLWRGVARRKGSASTCEEPGASMAPFRRVSEVVDGVQIDVVSHSGPQAVPAVMSSISARSAQFSSDRAEHISAIRDTP